MKAEQTVNLQPEFEGVKELVNLTGHKMDIIIGFERVFLPSRGIARVEEHRTLLGRVCSASDPEKIISVYSIDFYPVVYGLPDEEPGSDKLYVVSAHVARALAGARKDVVCGGDHIRAGGMVEGAQSLLFGKNT
jgi:hypothetical protein